MFSIDAIVAVSTVSTAAYTTIHRLFLFDYLPVCYCGVAFDFRKCHVYQTQASSGHEGLHTYSDVLMSGIFRTRKCGTLVLVSLVLFRWVRVS